MTMLSALTRLFRRADAPAQSSASILERGTEGPYCQMQALLTLRWVARTLTLNPGRQALQQQTGPHRSRFRGRGMEFAEVRAYQPGDDVRSIDWRVTARRQKVHTKLFNEERERPVFIVCDQSLSQFFGSRQTFKSVRAAEATALLAWTALDHGDRVGGIVFSDQGHREFKPARSRKKLLQLLQAVADYNQQLHVGMPLPSAPFSLHDALTETVRLLRPGTLLVLISDFHDFDADCEAQLQRLARHNDMLLIHTLDATEIDLPEPGFYPISDGNETLVLDTGTTQRQRYHDWMHDQRTQLDLLSQRLRAPRLEVLTHELPAHALQRTLQALRA